MSTVCVKPGANRCVKAFDLLNETRDARMAIIAVDDFSAEEYLQLR